jgi:hypothetical protein
MKKKLAVFLTKWGTETVLPEWAGADSDYARATEYVEVDFPELQKETVITNQVAQLDSAIATIKAKAIEEVDKLNQKKSELLALTHEVSHEHI